MAKIWRTFWLPYEILNYSNNYELQKTVKICWFKSHYWKNRRFHCKFFTNGRILFKSSNDRNSCWYFQKELFQFNYKGMLIIWSINWWLSLSTEHSITIPSLFHQRSCCNKAKILPIKSEWNVKRNQQSLYENCFSLHQRFLPFSWQFHKKIL